jgi:DNA-binding PucR family transcriptional regulator
LIGRRLFKEAAERSFVHHKTILLRKNRIEEILGVSIDDVKTRLTLSTAMKILRLLQK